MKKQTPIYTQYFLNSYYIVRNCIQCDNCGKVTKIFGSKIYVEGKHLVSEQFLSLPQDVQILRVSLHHRVTKEKAQDMMPELPLEIREAELQHRPFCEDCVPSRYTPAKARGPRTVDFALNPPEVVPSLNLDLPANVKPSRKIKRNKDAELLRRGSLSQLLQKI